ncbi:MAG: TRAP transporter small permease [Deltaproteobacteria bacterium]|nr:TRAP transporter small permease [Deltaproteobacteria bacterium]
MENIELKKRLSAIYDKTVLYLAYIACILLALITLAETAEIIIRKFGNTSLPWVIEFSEHALVFIAFLAGVWVLKEEAHIKVDIVLNMFSPRIRSLINVINSMLGAILCLFLSYRSALMVLDLWKRQVLTSKTVEIPMWPLFAVFCIGSFLISIQFFIRAQGYFKTMKQSQDIALKE